jgi:hypothetical protein
MSQRAFLRGALVITTAVAALLGGVAASASGTGQHRGNARCTRPAVSGDPTVDVAFGGTVGIAELPAVGRGDIQGSIKVEPGAPG